MVTKLNKNVMFVKEIPSNLIEEVILILKTEDKKIKNKTKDLLMIEANDIIEDCSMRLQKELDIKRKTEREEKDKKKRQRTNLIAIAAVLTVVGILFFFAKMFA